METPYSNPRIPNTRNLESDSITFPDGSEFTTATKIQDDTTSVSVDGSVPKVDFTIGGGLSGQFLSNRLQVPEIRAPNSNGLKLYNDGGNDGLFVADNGHVGIGDTTPNQKLQVAGSAYIDTNLHVNNYIRPGSNDYLKWLSGDGGDGIHRWRMNWYSGTTSQLEFRNLAGDNNCNIKAKSYHNISDDRVKTNETPILNATDTIKKLNPVKYDYYGNFDCSGDSNVSAGLVGQEVWYNAPELRFIINPALDASLNHDISSNDDWGTDALGINYSELIPYLIKSNQELEARISALEN